MKRILPMLLLVLLLAACTAPDADPSAAPDADDPFAALAPVELIGADSAAIGAAGNRLGELVAERVAELTGGKLTVAYYNNAQLGGDADLHTRLQSGSIDYLVCQTAPTASFVPAAAVFDLPMVFARYDGETINSVLNGDGAFRGRLDEEYARSGILLMAFLQNGTYRVTTSDRPLRTLDDFRGLVIRTMDNPNHIAFWKALGASPTPAAWTELYVLLSQGAVDAQENAADTCLSANFQQVQQYLNDTDHILYLNQLLVSEQTFSALDPAYQAAFRQAVDDSVAALRDELSILDEESRAALTAAGMEVISYDAGFYDTVLALPGVQSLYAAIDEQTGGLAALLQSELAATAGEGLP